MAIFGGETRPALPENWNVYDGGRDGHAHIFILFKIVAQQIQALMALVHASNNSVREQIVKI